MTTDMNMTIIDLNKRGREERKKKTENPTERAKDRDEKKDRHTHTHLKHRIVSIAFSCLNHIRFEHWQQHVSTFSSSYSYSLQYLLFIIVVTIRS
jgi:hypothetical protein